MRDVAVKIVPFTDDTKESVLREATLLSSISDDNIIKMYRSYTSGNYLVMHLEYFRGETMSEYIARTGSVNSHHARRILDSLSEAIRYLHSKGISHNDIHTGNVLINGNREIKLIDFGDASEATRTSRSNDLTMLDDLFETMRSGREWM